MITETSLPSASSQDRPRLPSRRRGPSTVGEWLSMAVSLIPPVLWVVALTGLATGLLSTDEAVDQMLAAVEAPGVVMLGFVLLCTPLSQLTGRNLRRRRKWFGLSFAFCAAGNLTVFLIRHPLPDLLQPFVIVALVALALTLPLAVTSTTRAVRWLGGRRWRRLHRLVYVVAALVIVHLWIVPQNDGPEGSIISTTIYGLAAMLRIPRVTTAVTAARARRNGASLLSIRTWIPTSARG